MDLAMLDLELLRSFVSWSTPAVHPRRRAGSSHPIHGEPADQALEDDIGQPLLNRSGKDVIPTEAGERLLSYARRLLALAEEARDVVARPGTEGAVRLGIPEDFAAYRLTKLLATFSRSRPGLRLDVDPTRAFPATRPRTRRTRSGAAQARRRRKGRHRGVAGAGALGDQQDPPGNVTEGSVPLIGFPAGCLYRTRAIHALESAGRSGTWPIPVQVSPAFRRRWPQGWA